MQSEKTQTEVFPFFDRDLSWLSFNYRILMEANDADVPLLERLRFLAIYSSNLDEFFRVRVAAQRELAKVESKKVRKKLGSDPQNLLEKILKTVNKQLEEYGRSLKRVYSELKKVGVVVCYDKTYIPPQAEEEVRHFFKTKVLAYLRPVVIQHEKGRYLLNNGELYFALRLKKAGEECLGFVNIPSTQLPRFYCFEHHGRYHFIFLEKILERFIGEVFSTYEVLECKSIKINRDADLHIDDEYSGNLVKKIEKQLGRRKFGESTRFLYDRSISEDLLQRLISFMDLEEPDLSPGGPFHNLRDLMDIKVPDGQRLEYPSREPIKHPLLHEGSHLLAQMEERDFILHFPYQSYEYVLQFFNEAVTDSDVESIDVTFYRMAKDSVIGEALISAALNGKEVNVFMEVKARFDEANNLQWAESLKKAGANIFYSMPGLKVHAKVAQIKRRVNGKIRYYGFFGTGNLNENTARTYCDHGLFSSREGMNRELAMVFDFLHNNVEPEPFKELIVSQFGAVDRFKFLIDREIEAARAGKTARMYIKINNLEERSMIKRLYRAAEAGVEIRLLVRSICCLVPKTNGLKVKRIVGRYLEHARIFYFHNGGDPELYMGSSDWMTRNLHNRVEVSFPVYSEVVRKDLMRLLELQWNDNEQAVWLSEDFKNIPVTQGDSTIINAQRDFYRYLKEEHTES